MIQRSALALVSAASILALAAPALAQESQLPTSDWRQADRSEALAKKVTSPQSLTFELRFGPYSPQVDDEPGLNGKTPYKDVFRPTGYSPQFYFGLELDYLPLRIPYVGAFGPGVGWGFTTTSELANYSDGAQKGQASTESTNLTIMPMHASAVLRLDELMLRTGVPIVPYAKAGFGMARWTSATSAGTEIYTKPDGTKVSSGGLSWGFQFSLGGALSLNFLDPRAAARLDATTGVNHAYVFGEWMNSSMVGRNSKGLYAGTSTWVLGLAIDM